jgi:hypothetical protein
MNYKLILQLSLFGLAMAIATVYWIPSNLEPAFWLVIFIVCAWFIAKKCSGKYFLNGFMVSIVNSIWITSAHIILFNTYLSHHSKEAEMMANMPMHESPRLLMLMTGPIIGIVSGLILGLFALLASKMVKKE